ncbi:hypothetical protein B0H65DRAFT_481493 [Neurospora tetraspora]|uniref:Uncharacterized protein n=1 Tax=Neurospora tetraspora TaxID=94610 RepID=A0AAE0IZR7_9PEZI|nr:hypothetical protein B0H65DRAFT_481493 [Neurospora tetraspora]
MQAPSNFSDDEELILARLEEANALADSSSSSSSDDLTSIPSSFPPDFDPYNTTLPAVLNSRNPSPSDYNGATPDRGQAKYNGPYTYHSHYCGAPRTWASVSAIHDGEGYLYGLGGTPRLGANKCSRVSCSWNSAIFVCNDNNHDISLHSWGNVAEAAYFLTGACFKYFGGQTRIAGQVYFSERWTVFITVQKC